MNELKAISNALPLLDEREVAEAIGMSVGSLRRWRLLGEGPKYIKIGAAVRYRREDLDAWISTRPTGGDQKQAANA